MSGSKVAVKEKEVEKKDNKGEKEDINETRKNEETMACGDMTGLKLRVRCHSEAPGCLIFHHVILALWIWTDCPRKTSAVHSLVHLGKVLTTKLCLKCISTLPLSR